MENDIFKTYEEIERRNEKTNRLADASIIMSVTTIILLILADLDKIVSFVRYALSCLR